MILMRQLRKALTKFGSLLTVPDGELAVFIADAGLPSKELYKALREWGYEPVMPYPHETQEELILPDTKFPTRKGEPNLELDVRRDGAPLCPRTDWDKKDWVEGRRPLDPRPSDLTAKAQRWRCPMTAVGECPTPCGLEPYYRDPDLPINTLYWRVKKFVDEKDEEFGFRYPLFPRVGAEAQTLLSYRGRVEHDFAYLKGRGCFGGDGEARLPIRGQERLQLRLLCTLIPLVALAMVTLGVPMPAELLDDWFAEIGPPPGPDAT